MPQVPENPPPKSSDIQRAHETQKFTEQQFQLMKELSANEKKQDRLNTYIAVAKTAEQKSVDASKKSSSSTKSPTKTDAKYEIEYLQKLIAYLEKYLGKNPAIAKELAKDQQLLKQIEKDYPNLTSKDMKDLEKIASQANSLSSKLTDKEKQGFIKIEIAMFGKMTGANKAQIAKLEKELSKYSDVAAAEKELQAIEAVLNYMIYGNENLSQSQLSALLTNIKDLMEQLPNLPKSMQEEVKKALKVLSGITAKVDGKTFHFGGIMADLQFKVWIQEYEASSANPTTAGLEAFLKKKVQQFEKSHGSTPLAEQMNKALNANLNALIEQAAKNPNGPFYPADSQGIIQSYSSPDFYYSVSKGIPETSEVPYNTYVKIIKNIQTFLKDSAGTISKIEKNIDAYKELNKIYAAVIQDLQVKNMWASNMQKAFYEAILNHYMPGQESYLKELANLLNFSNFGANMDNALMSDLTGFGNAEYDFNFNSWLQGQKVPSNVIGEGTYKGSVQQAKEKVQAEESNIKKDLSKANKALGDISATESKIKQEVKDGKLTPAQGKKLINELEGYKKNITTAITNLKKLYGALQSLKFSPATNKDGKTIPGEFTVNGDTETVAHYENQLVNGKASKGGLSSIANEISAAQKSWGSQSQTNQMQLQLVMTEIQQEWAIVATALSQLNQIYLTFARGTGGK